MIEAMLEIILRRDRIIVAAALAALTALAWTYVLWLAADMDMGGMEMTGFRMVPAGIGIMAPAFAPWQAIEFVYMFAMWAVMMVGMMTPSAAPMILIYARVGRQASAQGKPFAATGWFATGYLLTWVGFAPVATAAQWALDRTALLDPKMASASRVFGGIILVAAGVYQWTPLKDKCLAQCQAPLLFIQRQGGFPTSWRILRRLLLGIDGAFVRRRRYERAVDRHDLCRRAHRKDCAHWSPYLADCRHRLCCGWDLACGWVVRNGTATLLH